MNESVIKSFLTRLIEKIIIPRYSFLELRSVIAPSEFLYDGQRMGDDFVVTFTSPEYVEPYLLVKIENDVWDLFVGASFNTYKEKGRKEYGIRTSVVDKDTGYHFSVLP
jgi:hypothetical protein